MSEPKRTLFSGRAAVLAEVFKHTVGRERFAAGDTVYEVELSMPDGESTEGGKLAVQHVALVAANGTGTLVIGTLFHVEKRAELRTFEQMGEIYTRRFGLPFPADPEAYERLLTRVEAFLEQNAFQSPPRAPSTTAAAPAGARATAPSQRPSASRMAAQWSNMPSRPAIALKPRARFSMGPVRIFLFAAIAVVGTGALLLLR